MRKRAIYLSIAILPALGGSAGAEICTVDAVPAATLLVPYFEVELNNPSGRTTLFTVNNVGDCPVVANLTFWTDWGIPTLTYEVYLEASAVQDFNLRDPLTTGLMPQTAPSGFPPPAHCPPIPGCFWPQGHLSPAQVQTLREAHAGAPVALFGGLCGGQDYGDGVARGYVTIDQVDACSRPNPGTSPLFPGSPGYFGGGGIAGSENVLWGDVFYVDPANDFAQGEMAVHVEAAPPGFFVPGDYTFYGQYVSFTAIDRREPLGTRYGTRFLTSPPFDRNEILCWRDSKSSASPRLCNTGPPPPMPLSQTAVVAHPPPLPPLPQPPPSSPQPPGTAGLVCPLVTQRVSIPSPALPLIGNGWLELNLNHSTGSPMDPIAQAWVGTTLGAAGRYSVGFDALQICSACDPAQCP